MNKEVWLVIFSEDLGDCNGVYSSKEKAIQTVDTHFKRLDGNNKFFVTWENRQIEEDCENWRIDTFDLVHYDNNKTISKKRQWVTIEKHYIDD